MTTTQGKTEVEGRAEIEETQVKRVRSWFIFKTEWWETVATKHLGNDIHILTNRHINHVYLNGTKIN